MEFFQLFNFLSSIGRKIKRTRQRGLKAFTLVEILITITILGILASIILVSTAGTREAARDGRRQS
ncbi:MAG: prepilin-type N-terminal cleavage/methylation domain-containing protein, partial [Candidatus Paceibacterota bacterium]